MLKKSPLQTRLGYFLLIVFLLIGFVLRFIYLDKIPQGFNWDEASVGYNAYCLAKTGRDEFGKSWPIFMEAFGEFKTGLYSMLLVPVIKLLGLSVLTVRLPNVIFGCLLILASFYLSLQIFKKTLPASLVAGLIAISPWAIHTSRFTLEWYFGVPLVIAGMGLLLASKRKKYFMLIAALFFAVSLYSYHALRLLVPLLLFFYTIFFRKTVFKEKKLFIISLIIGFLALLPLFNSMKNNKWFTRASDVALFTNEGEQNELMKGMYRHVSARLPLVRLFNNKVVFYGREVLSKYLPHFSPQFLFLGEDVTPRIGIEKVGKLYLASIPFLILGLYELFKKKSQINRFLILWFLLAPIPSSLTIDSPHALRSFLLIPVFQIITVKGMISAYHYFQVKKPKLLLPFVMFVGLAYLTGMSFFLWRYFLFYPEDTAASWQDGHQQMVEKLNEHKDDFENIIITTHYGQPHIFVAFFTPIAPEIYQKEGLKVNQQGIFNGRVPYLGNIQFKGIKSEDFCLPNALIIIERSDNIPKNVPRLDIVTIANRFQKPEVAFEMFDTNNTIVYDTFCAPGAAAANAF